MIKDVICCDKMLLAINEGHLHILRNGDQCYLAMVTEKGRIQIGFCPGCGRRFGNERVEEVGSNERACQRRGVLFSHPYRGQRLPQSDEQAGQA